MTACLVLCSLSGPTCFCTTRESILVGATACVLVTFVNAVAFSMVSSAWDGVPLLGLGFVAGELRGAKGDEDE